MSGEPWKVCPDRIIVEKKGQEPLDVQHGKEWEVYRMESRIFLLNLPAVLGFIRYIGLHRRTGWTVSEFTRVSRRLVIHSVIIAFRRRPSQETHHA